MAKALKAEEPKPAPIGHNTSEEAIVRTYVADMVALKAEQQAVADKIKARRKLVKAQHPDILLTELDRVIKMSTWSHDEIRDSFDRSQRYARFLGMPTGTQADLFAELPDHEAVREKWRQRGYTDGSAGRGVPEVPPKECPPDAAQAYGEGWQEGQKATLAAYAEANGVADDLAKGAGTPIGDAANKQAA